MTSYRYIEWFEAEELHSQTKEWVSQLLFIGDEQHFLNTLTKSMGFKAIHQNQFEELKKFRATLSKKSKSLVPLIEAVQLHRNDLEVLLDGKDQLEKEKSYRRKHLVLLKRVNQYVSEYQRIKKEGFDLISLMLKDGRKLLLGNPEYKLTKTSSKAIL